MGVLYGGSSCPQKMGWRVAVIAVLLCGSSQGRPSLLGAAGEDHHHHHEEQPAAPQPQMVMDASFNFAVDETEHQFKAEADRTGERTGSYSYMAPDGTLVKVRYTAGRDGFVILNPDEVLPQAPQV